MHNTRELVVGAAQLGPIQRSESRESVVARMLNLLEEAATRQCDLVVFPELCLTTFFPRWYFEEQREIDSFFETAVPSAATEPLFAAARKLSVGFYMGYAELDCSGDRRRRFNTSILVDRCANIVGKYRKVHLPGHQEHEPWRPFQHLEKRYFESGDLGFPVWQAFGGTFGMCICNDRRWPETYRVMGLRGVEMIMLGYNTPAHYPPVPEHDHLQNFHHQLVMQAGAYQNGTWVVASAKAGCEEGCELIGQSCIIAPTGEIVAMSSTLEDELITASCDLDACRKLKEHVFNFRLHRQVRHYATICAGNGGNEEISS